MRCVKGIGVLAMLSAILAVAGCGKKVVDANRLVDRDGLRYEIGSETPFTGTRVSYHSNGQKQSEGEYQNGRAEGGLTVWYENGQKMAWGRCREGTYDGKWTFLYKSGKIKREDWLRNGKLNGKVTSWYENGQKEAEVEWRDGSEVSRTEWDENGTLIKQPQPQPSPTPIT